MAKMCRAWRLMMGDVIVYDTGEVALDISVEHETAWLKTEDIALLFSVNRPAIVKHIGNIYKTDELEEYSTCSNLEQVAKDGKRRKIEKSNKYHDRFLILDKTKAYHIGASLKDLGKKVFAFSEIDVEMLRLGDA